MALIMLGDTLFNTDHIVAVRPSGLDSKHTIIFTVGQSAVDDGFLVRVPYHEVSRRLRESRMSYLMELAEMMGDDETEEEGEEEERDRS